jgi:hypothetical protein
MMKVLDWTIKMMSRKAFMVKVLLLQELQPRCSLHFIAMMKLKTDVMKEIDDLVNDSLQC